MKCYHCDSDSFCSTEGGIPLCFPCAGGVMTSDKELTQRGLEPQPRLSLGQQSELRHSVVNPYVLHAQWFQERPSPFSANYYVVANTDSFKLSA